MTLVVNTHQAQAWNGYEGRHWARHQDRYDALNAGLTGPLFAAAGIVAGERVLDVGCGNGATTRLAARAARPGRVVGIDLSAPMLAVARASSTAERLDNVDYRQGDAQVYDFGAERFDVAISRAGVMFFADQRAAFGNLGGALRPGGRLAFVSLGAPTGDDEMWQLFDAVRAHGSGTPDTGAQPDSLADPAHVAAVLTDAGFTGIRVEPTRVPLRWGRDAADAAEFLLGWGPVRHWLRDADPAAIAAARADLHAALSRHERPDGVRTWSTCLVTSARRPGPGPAR
ncbi:methyltransferase [Actinocatenispora thailandica]|uniref:Methyltransferase n=1 Tax=Actinocatenispora thailandica TaxID=227318 RepID=A0A7R7HW58_9ACTN|nr:class I SAM-dependent methyltransferase [Actinocatenispora thailandica]BCJ34548.1 methyltransferase [Actinocatenispora thailandica]